MTIVYDTVTITLFGYVTPEREATERAIARYRHEQLSYVRAACAARTEVQPGGTRGHEHAP